jgi:hypothetical protein
MAPGTSIANRHGTWHTDRNLLEESAGQRLFVTLYINMYGPCMLYPSFILHCHCFEFFQTHALAS